jgi:hypothetical protein
MANLAKASTYELAERPYTSNPLHTLTHSVSNDTTRCVAITTQVSAAISGSCQRYLGGLLSTFSLPTVLRAKVSGRYISDALAPGAENSPVDVARTK